MTNFRRIFNPTIEEQLQDIDFCINLYKNSIGHCCTCKYYKGSISPGFVTDYGECSLKSPIFLRKNCTTMMIECPNYSENIEMIKDLEKHREKILKKENE